MNDRSLTANEKKTIQSLHKTLETCEEFYGRGFRINNVNMKLSDATTFKLDPNDPKALIPPFVVVDGLGEAAAISIVKAREEADFMSKQDLQQRTSLSSTNIDKLAKLGALEGLPDSNQISLFD